MTSPGSNQTGNGDSGHGARDRDELRMWMSALLDGELDPEQEAELLVALDEDPRLALELEALAGGASFAALAAGPVDLADAVMAAVGPGEISASADGAARLTSLAVDDELDAAGTHHLEALLGDATPGASFGRFLDVVEATRASVDGALAHPGPARWLLDVPADVEQVLDDDARCLFLASAALDGETTAAENVELSALLSNPAHRSYRQAGFAAFAATHEALQLALHSLEEAPEAARAGAAALQAVAALQANEQREARAAQTHLTAPAAPGGLMPWLRHRMGFIGPFAFAGAALVLFLVTGDSSTGPVEHPDPGSLAIEDQAFLREVDEGLAEEARQARLALAEDLPLIEDNHSEVELIDTASSTTMVFDTAESGITIIWVSEATPDLGEGDDSSDAPYADDEDEVKGT